MGFFDWFKRKESPTRISLLLNQVGQAQPTPKNYENFAKEGYAKNVITFRCINLIANSCASVEWDLYQKSAGRRGQKTEIETHPLLSLIDRPNPLQSKTSFFQSLISYFVMTGNGYTHAVGPAKNAPPLELWPLEPQFTKVIPSKNGYVQGYQFDSPSGQIIIPVDFISMKSPVLHLKTFNPLSPLYGMSPIEAAMLSIDQQNAASTWNLGLLKNSATPSGVLTVEATDLNPYGALSTEQFDRLKEQVEQRYSGPQNAKRPMILEGGLKWSQMSIDPVDMEFIKGKELTTREIANAFGVPPMLLNIAGDNTYANYSEARLAFYEDTVLPILDFVKTSLNFWLTPVYGERLELAYDKDEIPALAEKREKKFSSVKDANFLTQNEKRVATGYEEKEGWDVFVMGSGEIISADEDPLEVVEPTETPEDPEDPALEDDPALDEEKKLEVKLFNNINTREKRLSAIKQNRIKERLIKDFEHDLADDFRKLERDLIALGKEINPRAYEFAFQKYIDDHAKEMEKTLSQNIKRATRTFGEMVFDSGKKHVKGWEKKETVKQAFKFSHFVEDFTKKKTAKSISEITGTTRKQVREKTRELLLKYEVDPHLDLPAALEKEFSGLTSWRARNIARTETTSAANGGSLEAVKTLEIPGMQKEWVATIDDFTRDDSAHANHVFMNGTRVGLDDKFTVPPDTDMEMPGDPSAPPEQICNCRCVLVYNAGK